jgi:hypothetical protein
LGTRQNDVSRLENGQRSVADLDEFVLVCRVLGLTPNAVLGFVEASHD